MKYYIFKIKDNIIKEDKISNIYKILESINNMNTNDYKIGKFLLEETVDKININIKNNILNDNKYYNYDNIHIINDLYNNEISILKIFNNYLTIDTTTKNITNTIKNIINDIDNLLIINFDKKEYCLLNM